jgi:hypothetical protein
MPNLASTELGRHLVWDGTNHRLRFTAAETKNDRAYAAAMPQNLTTYVHHWLNACRPNSAINCISAAQIGGRLWLNRWGHPRPAAPSALRSSAAPGKLGNAVSRHLFRDCAVTELVDCAPEHIGIA